MTKDEQDPIDFSSLPREEPPPPWVEETLVAELRHEGRIGSELAAPAGRTTRSGWTRPAWALAAALAGISLFTTGLLFGERRGSERTLAAFEAASQTTVAVEAARAQRLGSLYVESLARLAATDGASGGEALDQGVESARTILWAAALELARIDPDDPTLLRVLEALSGDTRQSEGAVRTHHWF